MEPTIRPLLRGYLHALAIVPAGAMALLLLDVSSADRAKQLSLAVYGLSAVLLFGISATYHVGRWGARVKGVLQRVDHATIFVLIAGTTTPCAYNLLGGGLRWAVLALSWGAALTGMALVAGRQMSDAREALLYFLIGAAPAVTLPALVQRAGWGMLLPVAGGALYGLGALSYARKRPNPWPRVMGFHEVFHVLTLAANGLFFAFMLVAVVPTVRPA